MLPLDPNIAVLLLGVGALAILWEFCHPGQVIPGVLGGVLCTLGLASLTRSAQAPRPLWAALVGAVVLGVSVPAGTVALRARRRKRQV